ncbi:hypothetical protein SLA2020_024260 [Shorea laevis]
MYSLSCRYANVGLLPSQQAEDADVSNYRLKLPNKNRQRRASTHKSKLENSNFAKHSLLFAAFFGTSMLIGDGVLTPCISVLSAIGGIKEATPKLTEDMIVWISAAYWSSFPWFRNMEQINYTGQYYFLRKHPQAIADAFYKSVPVPLYWPMFVVAVFASIIGSQSLISGTFSIIQQSLSLGCFPHVKVVRTSSKYEGQVYIPEINYLLMLACLGVTLNFKTTDKISNAYGNYTHFQFLKKHLHP